jgi:hypothetical protein
MVQEARDKLFRVGSQTTTAGDIVAEPCDEVICGRLDDGETVTDGVFDTDSKGAETFEHSVGAFESREEVTAVRTERVTSRVRETIRRHISDGDTTDSTSRVTLIEDLIRTREPFHGGVWESGGRGTGVDVWVDDGDRPRTRSPSGFRHRVATRVNTRTRSCRDRSG